MELAGLAVAQSCADFCAANGQPRSVLVVSGPGNNGGDGLVAARHLQQFGFAPTVFYPKPVKKPLFEAQVRQCESSDIPVHQPFTEESWAEQVQALRQGHYGILLDAVFGFSFAGELRPPFDQIIKDITHLKKEGKCPQIVSVDIPSGWDVEKGNVNNTFEADMLVSLTAPKRAAAYHRGAHYLGGRFVPQRVLAKYACHPPKGIYTGAN